DEMFPTPRTEASHCIGLGLRPLVGQTLMSRARDMFGLPQLGAVGAHLVQLPTLCAARLVDDGHACSGEDALKARVAQIVDIDTPALRSYVLTKMPTGWAT